MPPTPVPALLPCVTQPCPCPCSSSLCITEFPLSPSSCARSCPRAELLQRLQGVQGCSSAWPGMFPVQSAAQHRAGAAFPRNDNAMQQSGACWVVSPPLCLCREMFQSCRHGAVAACLCLKSIILSGLLAGSRGGSGSEATAL